MLLLSCSIMVMIMTAGCKYFPFHPFFLYRKKMNSLALRHIKYKSAIPYPPSTYLPTRSTRLPLSLTLLPLTIGSTIRGGVGV